MERNQSRHPEPRARRDSPRSSTLPGSPGSPGSRGVDLVHDREGIDDAEWSPRLPPALRGRGSAENPVNRFERLHYDHHESDAETEWAAEESARFSEGDDATGPRPAPTVYLRDASRSILATNDSPDVPFDTSLNPYRGCEHGCVYCYARPSHEYLGFSSGLDFETRILVKEDAAALLRRELASRRWRPQLVGMCGVTDPYQPIERRLEITRACLRVFAEFRNPVGIVTKSSLVTRDVDLLSELAGHRCSAVNISITTLDPKLHRIMEPRASHPNQRLRAIEALSRAGVPVGVMVAPVIPGLTDHEIPQILEAAADAGAVFAGMIALRLPRSVEQLFDAWLERHFPDRRNKVLNRIRSMRGGKLNDPRFGSRMRGEGGFAEPIHDLFHLARRRAGIGSERPALSTDSFRRTVENQLELF